MEEGLKSKVCFWVWGVESERRDLWRLEAVVILLQAWFLAERAEKKEDIRYGKGF